MKHFGQESGGIVMKLIVALGVVTFLFFFYLVRHPMFRFIAESWIVEDPLNKADALIVLSDDNFYADRATRAAELFRERKASKLFMREILGMMVAVWERRHGTETSSASQGIVEGGKRSPLSMV